MEILKILKDINNENIIIDAIANVRKLLGNLTEERMCRVYSSYVFEKIRASHISARIVSTLDLGFDFDHQFVLVPDESFYYLIDLTFSQFNYLSDNFEKLKSSGYQKIDANTFSEYLSIVTNSKNLESVDLDNVYFSTGGRR